MPYWDLILRACEISDFKLIPLNYRPSQNKLYNNDDYFLGLFFLVKDSFLLINNFLNL